MSGSGKSYWSKKLQLAGYYRICCDDLIEKKLSKELVKLGFRGIQDVASWMGQPYERRHKRASETYLRFEKETLDKAIQELPSMKKNVVIDTTGSVIYIGKRTLDALKKQTTIVFLNVPETVKNEMYKLYLKDPKPVVWGKSFKKNYGESNLAALARCYPTLLKYRTLLYQLFADITMDYQKLRKPGTDVSDFLRLLHLQLQQSNHL